MMASEHTPRDLEAFLDARLPGRDHQLGQRILRIELTREDALRALARDVAERYEKNGFEEIAERLRSAVEPKHGQGRPQTRLWLELREWLLDDVKGILQTNPTLSERETFNRLRQHQPWADFTAGAIRQHWREYWKERGFQPADALKAIKARVKVVVK